MAEYEIQYVDVDALHREIDSRGWDIEEADILAAAQKGDDWIRAAIEKHGEDAHTTEVLTHFATQWAWLQVMVWKIGSRHTDEPLFMRVVREECRDFLAGGVATYTRAKVTSKQINRGMPE